MSAWQADLHPRDTKGEFSKKPGGGSSWAHELSDKLGGVTPGEGGASLEERLQQGERDRKPLTGGSQGKVFLVTLDDGSKVVEKSVVTKPRGRKAADQLDAEELASKYARALGIDAPDVVRKDKKTVVMEHKDGDVLDVVRSPMNREGAARLNDSLANSREGRIIGLFDMAVRNVDRNPGNVLVKDGKPQAIDHGMAFQDGDDRLLMTPMLSGYNIFVNGISAQTDDSKYEFPRHLNRSSAYSRADIEHMIEVLKSLEDEFAAKGRQDWYERTLANLEAMKETAGGKGRLF